MNIKYIINFIEQYRYTKNNKSEINEMTTFLRKRKDKSFRHTIRILASLFGWVFLGMALYAVFFKDIVTNKDIVAIIALGFIYLIYTNESHNK